MRLIKTKKERIPQYDLIRAAAMFLVVYVHSSFMFSFTSEENSKHAALYWFTSVLALSCNALFFMVSGKFNLGQTEKLELKGYRSFYTKKGIDLLLPIAFYALVFWILRFAGIRVFGAWDDGVGFWDLWAFLKMVHQLLVSSWWFVPMIFSLMIFTPFLGRMLGSLKNKEVYVLLVAIFGCAGMVAVEKTIGLTEAFSKFFVPAFGTWAGVYMLGYAIDKEKMSQRVLSRWYTAAIALVAAMGVAVCLYPQIFMTHDRGLLPVWNSVLSALFYPVVAGAVFLWFKNIKIANARSKQVAEFVGNRAFGVYLIHFCFYFSYLHLLPEWLRGADDAISGIAKRITITVVVYVASLLVATVVDLLIVGPVQKRVKAKLLG